MNMLQKRVSNLGIFATLEERRDANQADVVIPHDDIFSILAWQSECVLEDY